jgi:hypothetical protein
MENKVETSGGDAGNGEPLMVSWRDASMIGLKYLYILDGKG